MFCFCLFCVTSIRYVYPGKIPPYGVIYKYTQPYTTYLSCMYERQELIHKQKIALCKLAIFYVWSMCLHYCSGNSTALGKSAQIMTCNLRGALQAVPFLCKHVIADNKTKKIVYVIIHDPWLRDVTCNTCIKDTNSTQ